MKRKILCSLAFTLVLFLALALGICANEAESTDLEDIFQFKGYSVSEDGGAASFGFTLNHEAKDALGEGIDIGIVIVSYDNLNGQTPLDENGNPRELNSGKVLKLSLNGYRNISYNFKLVNFTEELYSHKYVISPYLYDGTNVYYYENGEMSEDVTGVSYEEILSFTREHTYECVIADEFLRSEATCKEYASYYKSCSVCGEVSSEWFYDESAYGSHTVAVSEAVDAT